MTLVSITSSEVCALKTSSGLAVPMREPPMATTIAVRMRRPMRTVSELAAERALEEKRHGDGREGVAADFAVAFAIAFVLVFARPLAAVFERWCVLESIILQATHTQSSIFPLSGEIGE